LNIASFQVILVGGADSVRPLAETSQGYKHSSVAPQFML